MQIFLKDIDYELGELIINGDFVLIMEEGDKIITNSNQTSLRRQQSGQNL